MDHDEKKKDFTYDAFISYRHTDPDKAIAKKLHTLLETYVVPKRLVKKGGSKKLKRVFRDREELPTSNDLGANIKSALEKSRFLIVICSPRTLESIWVMQEVELFKEIHGREKILLLLIEGEPEESFPKTLCYEDHRVIDENGNERVETVEVEPLAADIRGKSLREQIKLLKTEKLRLLAPIIGCGFDDLKQRHRERVIKNRMLLGTSISLFILVFGFFALHQQQEVEEQKTIAQEQRKSALEAESITLSERAEEELERGNVTLAMRVALAALPQDIENPERPFSTEAMHLLNDAIYYPGYSRSVLNHSSRVLNTWFSQDGEEVLSYTGTPVDSFKIWKVSNGKRANEGVDIDGGTGFDVHKSSKKAVRTSLDHTVRVWNYETNEEILNISMEDTPFNVKFDPQGEKIAFISRDDKGTYSRLHVWNIEKEKEIGKAELNKDEYLHCFIFSNDGNSVAIKNVASNNVIDIIDLNTWQSIGRIEDTEPIRIFEFSKDDKNIITASINYIKIWSCNNFNEIRNINTSGILVNHIVSSQDGEKFAASTIEGKIYVFNLSNSNISTLSHTGEMGIIHPSEEPVEDNKWIMNEPVFNPHGNLIITSAADNKTAIIWDVNNAIELVRFNHNDTINDIAFSPDGLYIATASDDHTVKTWSINRKELVRDFSSDEVTRFIKEDEDNLLAMCGGGDDTPYNYKYFDIYSINLVDNELKYLFKFEENLKEIHISKHKEKVITYSIDNVVKIWDINTKKIENAFQNVQQISFNKERSRFVMLTEKGVISIIDTDNNSITEVFKPNHRVIDIMFTPKTSNIVVMESSDNGENNRIISVVDVLEKKEISNYTLEDLSRSIGFSSDGSKIFAHSNDGEKVEILDLISGEKVVSLGNEIGWSEALGVDVFYSPNGNLAAIIAERLEGTDSTSGLFVLYIYDLRTGKEILRSQDHEGTIEKVAFSSDGRFAASSSTDNTIKIWDLERKEEIATLSNEKILYKYGSVDDLFFCSDNLTLCAGSVGASQTWQLFKSDGEAIEYVRKILGDYELTSEEKKVFLNK